MSNLKKWIMFLKKDLAKCFGTPKKVLFGSEKQIKKYEKKKEGNHVT